MARHLITGGNGFLGNHLARLLLDRGERVRILDVVDDPFRDSRSEFHQGDVTRPDQVRRALSGVDFVFHNAALVPLRKAADRFQKVNVEGTRVVLNCAREAGIRHFCHTSSSAVYNAFARSGCPISEATPLDPIEIYGRSKLGGELLVQREIDSGSEMTCSIIRPRTIVGRERLGIFQILFEWISEGRNIYVIGSGKNLFQFVHIDDLAEAMIQSTLARVPGAFNIGADRFRTLREDLEDLCRHAGTGSRVVGTPAGLSMFALWVGDKLRLSPLAPWHYRTYHKDFYFDITRAREELGWSPRYSNIEMFTEAYDWFLDARTREALPSGQTTSTHRSRLRQGVLSVLKKLS